MWKRRELKTKAKAAFKANYWKCVFVAFIMVLVASEIYFTAFIDGAPAKETKTAPETAVQVTAPADESIDNLPAELTAALEEESKTNEVSNRISISMGVMALSLLITIFFINPFVVGCQHFFKKNSAAPAEPGEMGFSFKNKYGNIIFTVFLRDLLILLWTLLFIIPGIVKSYSYRLVPYIISDNPGLSGEEALKKSSEMMKGNKWKTFVLDLSFIWWFLLSIITFGIVYLFYVNPYYLATDAELYLKLKETNAVVPEN